jgi:hypothetical protein
MGIFFFSCENTITDIPVDINYGVVINEINYRSSDSFNPEDWLELYNPTNETIAMDLWIFKDDNNNTFTIPENTILSAGDFIVLCKDGAAFENQFPQVANFIGDFGFGLSGGGELLRLFDSNESLVDSVEYDNEYSWPPEPNGNGPTLELIHPSLDNNKASNWAASNGNGTPGEINSVYDDE